MEQQPSSLKVSRSAARHLRRKKLVAARKESDRIDPSCERADTPQKIILVDKVAYKNTCSINETDTSIQPVKIYLNNDKKDSASTKVVSLINYNNIDSSKPCEKNYVLMSKKGQDKKVQKSSEQENTTTVVPNTCTFCEIVINHNLQGKMDSPVKVRSDVETERKVKKAAKAAAKAKAKEKVKTENVSVDQVDNVQRDSINEKSNTILKNIESSLSNMSISKVQPESKSLDIVDKNKSDSKFTPSKESIAPENTIKTEEKSKAELRAERRAKQEAQRAAKQTTAKSKLVKMVPEKTSQTKPAESAAQEKVMKKISPKPETKDGAHEVKLFKHLYINRKNISEIVNCKNVKLHSAILRLGVQYAEKVIVGSNARCVALFAAIKQLINDYERPPQADFTRGLEASLQESVNYLNFCRPSAVSMQNALKHLKWQMSTLTTTISDEEAKSKLAHAIDTYIKEQILLADTAISDAIQGKISDGDVILTYGFSSLIYKILCDAFKVKKQFRVIIIDSRPWLEGKELLRRLVKHGIDCSYMLINALSYIMPQVSKVFLGAHAILANGAVMSRVGTAQVALMAKAFNVPVLVACETHKSCERVQTDSIVYNEIGDPDLLVKSTVCNSKKSSLFNWRSKKTLNLLNITYDVTPADLVTAVVTELAILPCTSVPVILRIKPSEI